VLRQVLGLDLAEVQRLRDDGVIGEKLEGAGTPAVVPLDQQVELGWLAGYDPEFEQFLTDAIDGDQAGSD
jgi:hypothetical protein